MRFGEECLYITPCGWCSRLDKPCEKKEELKKKLDKKEQDKRGNRQ